MRHLLFLCTGNYFRSRFAAILFNALAVRAGLDWRAWSRGIAIDLGVANAGPISIHAIQGLKRHGLPADGPFPDPVQLAAAELACADGIIALKRAEHQPLMAARFPRWARCIEYWHIDDIDAAPADQALDALAGQIAELVARLRKQAGGQT